MSWGPWSGGGDTGEEATRRSDSHPRASTEKWEKGVNASVWFLD